jgi:hypothetical protein
MKLVKSQFVLLLLTLSTIATAGQYGGNKFPDGPEISKTPGVLCSDSTNYRYPERIKYCERNVGTGLKNQVIADYDKEFGYNIKKMNRGDFKIDHFIPLSIGGANDAKNLWPQHKSVYAYSDPLESEVSNLIVRGKIKQAEAIRVIKECKLNLGRCAELGDYLKSLN